MKKVLVVLVMLLALISMSTSVFAEPGGFVSSPSGNQAPTLVSGSNSDEACDAKLVITTYADRSEISEEARAALEAAYTAIVNASDLSTLNSALAALAAELGVDVKDLAVSDLFDISSNGCTGTHADHGHFDITLQSDTLENFVCLLHYYNGEWRIVENAEVTNNGQHLEFDEKEFSPFAIVVSTGAAPVQPEPDSNVLPIVLGIVGGVVALAAIVVAILLVLKNKKPGV